PSMPDDWPSGRGPSSGKSRTSPSIGTGFRIEVARSVTASLEGVGCEGTAPIAIEEHAIEAAIEKTSWQYRK
ncbi:MAG: hypothetical protein AABZ24_04335, partial [Nitrospirota bacterium]